MFLVLPPEVYKSTVCHRLKNIVPPKQQQANNNNNNKKQKTKQQQQDNKQNHTKLQERAKIYAVINNATAGTRSV